MLFTSLLFSFAGKTTGSARMRYSLYGCLVDICLLYKRMKNSGRRLSCIIFHFRTKTYGSQSDWSFVFNIYFSRLSCVNVCFQSEFVLCCCAWISLRCAQVQSTTGALKTNDFFLSWTISSSLSPSFLVHFFFRQPLMCINLSLSVCRCHWALFSCASRSGFWLVIHSFIHSLKKQVVWDSLSF